MSVVVQASSDMFRFYRSGLILSNLCGTNVDLAVLVVGYGVASLFKTEYYIVKNSWSAAWGDYGYVKIGI